MTLLELIRRKSDPLVVIHPLPTRVTGRSGAPARRGPHGCRGAVGHHDQHARTVKPGHDADGRRDCCYGDCRKTDGGAGSARDDDEFRILAGFLAEALVGTMRKSPARSIRKSARSRPRGFRYGRAIARQLAAAAAGLPLRPYVFPWRIFRFSVVVGVPCLRLLGGSETRFQRKVEFVVFILQRREQVRPERLLRMVDGDRRAEQRREILPHINLAVAAADEIAIGALFQQRLSPAPLAWEAVSAPVPGRS